MTVQTAEGRDLARGAAAFTPIRWPRLAKRPEGATPSIAASMLALDHISDAVLVADMRLRGHPIVRNQRALWDQTGIRSG